jgi:hypothetical protein
MTDQTISVPPEPKRLFHADASIACRIGSVRSARSGDDAHQPGFRARDNKLGSKFQVLDMLNGEIGPAAW